MSRFDYVKYDEDTSAKQAAFKMAFEAIEECVRRLPSNRATAIVYTKLEEAYMWVGKSLRDEQILKNGSAELLEERKDG